MTVTELRWLPGRGALTGTTADFTSGGQGFPGAVQPRYSTNQHANNDDRPLEGRGTVARVTAI